MDKIIFSVLLLSLIAFIDVSLTIKRPLFNKINYLFLILIIFIYNFIVYNNMKTGFLFIIIPLLNISFGSSFVILINSIISDKIYTWVKVNIIISLVLGSIFSYIMYAHPYIYSFHTQELISFYVLPKYWYLNVIRNIFKFLTLGSFLILTYKLINKRNINNYYTQSLKKWMLRIGFSFFAIILNVSILNFFNKSISGVMVVKGSLIVISYIVLLSFIYKPSFLKFHRFSFNKLSAFDKSTTYLINDANFTKPFFTNHYYLNKDANLERFCKENGIEEKEDFHDLVIIKFNMSFNNLINKHRVLYFLDLVKSKKYKNYSIDALAQESGFNSRHHLYKPFKKFHGGTPSDFIYYTND